MLQLQAQVLNALVGIRGDIQVLAMMTLLRLSHITQARPYNATNRTKQIAATDQLVPSFELTEKLNRGYKA